MGSGARSGEIDKMDRLIGKEAWRLVRWNTYNIFYGRVHGIWGFGSVRPYLLTSSNLVLVLHE
jgi:hypothetical protein